jgi:signal peptidase I
MGLEFAKQVAWSMPVAVAFTDLVANVVRVEGPSMSPTFNPGASTSGRGSGDSCDWVVVEKVSYRLLHSYHRGDVATLW